MRSFDILTINVRSSVIVFISPGSCMRSFDILTINVRSSVNTMDDVTIMPATSIPILQCKC